MIFQFIVYFAFYLYSLCTLYKFCCNIEDQKTMSWTVLLLRGFVINTLRRKDIVGVHQQVQLASLVSSTLNFIKTMCVK